VPSAGHAQYVTPRKVWSSGWHDACQYSIGMLLPAVHRDGWAKFPFGDMSSPDGATGCSTGLFKVGTKGHLHSLSPPHAHSRALDAIVWRIDRDGVVFHFTGLSIAPPPLETVPRARQVRLSNAWLWAWETTRG